LVHAIDWLFRFTKPQDWEREGRPVVWPSARMQQEALGLSPTQAKEVEHFRTSPGGYFHGMVAKAKAGELHLERTVWAMRRASEPEHQRAGRGGGSDRRDGGRA
jgi:hypothetical protein